MQQFFKYILLNTNRRAINHCLLLIVYCLLTACSQYSNSPTSLAWHNLNSKYNSLWMSEVSMKEADETLFKNWKDNYSQPLPILIPIDSIASQAVSTQLNDVIKKSSLIPERHQNSKFIDNAYVLIAKARLYKEDYRNAIETCKYVNTNAENDDQRHAALILLMRAYTEQGEYNTALRVAAILKEEDLSKDNTRDFYLVKAYLHQLKKEYALSTAILEETFDYLPKRESTARIHFATAQMYQDMGQMDLAAAHYGLVRYNRPSYDMRFYADLNKSLVEGSLTNFDKMLKEPKNADLLDKVYFSMAMVELGKKNLKQGIRYLQLSAQNTKGQSSQVPFTYLKLAEIHYEQLQDYEKAKSYYDSALSTMQPKMPEYQAVSEKKKVLDEFVKQLTIIRTQDSLQRLASMNPVALDKYLEKIIRQQEAEKRRQEEIAKQIVAQAQVDKLLAANTPVPDQNQSNWYFSNAIGLAKGKTDFLAKWGNRTLEDNWRRKAKETSVNINDVSLNTSNSTPQGAITANESDEDRLVKTKKTEYMTQIPFTKEALASSRKKQEDAMFVLGKIYKLNLNEPRNAVITFEKLLSDFPQTAYEPEVLYLLYLLNEDNKAGKEAYKNKLLEKYNNTYFARLATNGTGKLTSGAEEEAQNLYAEAYNYYTQNNYEDALNFIETGLKNYPNSQIEDKFSFMRTLLLAKTKGITEYQAALNDFIKSFPKSELLARAKEMLAAMPK